MKFSKSLVAMAIFAGAAFAAPVINSSGLASPTSNVTMDEVVLPDFTALSNQYASLGVTFAGSFYNPQSCAGLVGFNGSHCAGNTASSGGSNPFTIFFTTAQTGAAMAFATNPGTTTFTAFLQGAQVETFTQVTTYDDPNTAYLGFAGISFTRFKSR